MATIMPTGDFYPAGKPFSTSECEGQHRFFALEAIGSEDDNKVIQTVVCTSCGEFKTHVIHIKEAK